MQFINSSGGSAGTLTVNNVDFPDGSIKAYAGTSRLVVDTPQPNPFAFSQYVLVVTVVDDKLPGNAVLGQATCSLAVPPTK
ncbi:hypothetical protein [Paraburkholderia kirstenboschensis]|uniref:hypothetical protein n=1 Tax=Paraburkholderia kirstenboschensis TaxID=1245436 RepID=UPI000FFC3EE4|nr:hypothetical protein [Paraburkholderia kirstenboschensis]